MCPEEKVGPVLCLINGLCGFYGKSYCYPSQRKILGLLARPGKNVKISLSTLNRRLNVIEGLGYLERRRRIRRDKKLGTVFQSTIYKITYHGYLALARLGVAVWKQLKDIAERRSREHKDVRKASKASPTPRYWTPWRELWGEGQKRKIPA